MRNIVYSLLAIAIIGSSCQKKVLDIEPRNLESDVQAFSTPAKIEAAVIGTYDGLQSAEFLAGRALVYVDLLGSDVFDRQGYFGDLPRFNILGNNSIAYNVWTAGYNSIGRANLAIDGISKNASKLTGDQAKAYIAECKFVRAVANFYLVNFFAQTYVYTADASHPGIPLITQSFNSENMSEANQPRSTVAQVYTAIISDLTDALTDLPETYGDVYSDKTRGTKGAAASLLSRVYLYKADYANAKKYAGDVIAQTYGTYALQSDPAAPFEIDNYTTDETVWSIPNNANDNPNTNNSLPMHYAPKGRADLPLSSTFLNVATNPYFALNDKRRNMIIPGVAATNTLGMWFTSKYTDIAGRGDWAPIIRYAEVLLNYAEAQAHLANGVDADAIDKLNEVRDRSKAITTPSYTVADFANKDELIAAILGERRIELAFEGHRFWDLMRNKLPVTGKFDSNGTSPIPTEPFGADKNVFPIPQVEIDKSGGILSQNKGY
jgi:hypothetical protein